MLELRSIFKSYQGQPLLEGVSFSVGEHETVCLLGPSGSGKSTILQIIAGLEAPDSGKVLWDGRDLASTPPHLRDFGLVFQDYALFPHLDVFENIAFGPRMKGWAREVIADRVDEVLDLVNLTALRHRPVANLSGGEQQRVALGRALAPRPRLLMLDEPLGALDRALRQELLEELRKLLKRARIPALYVTHDQEEAFKLADRITLLHDGKIVRDAAPSEIWAHPGSPWAAEFLGLGAVLTGTVLPRRRLKTSAGVFALPCRHRHRSRDVVRVLARPRQSPRGIVLSGTVADATFQPDGYRVHLQNGLFYDAARPP
ncbi:MAG TPA: ABC transporter ATP-binding protein, partial [Anaerolineales bacterium]|nr:ABC transporter ATP-binding protein [Anaerolineales bacterium]